MSQSTEQCFFAVGDIKVNNNLIYCQWYDCLFGWCLCCCCDYYWYGTQFILKKNRETLTKEQN